MKPRIPSLLLSHYCPSQPSVDLFDLWYREKTEDGDWVPVGNFGPVLIAGWKGPGVETCEVLAGNPWVQTVELQPEDFDRVRSHYLEMRQVRRRGQYPENISEKDPVSLWKTLYPEQCGEDVMSVVQAFIKKQIIVMDLSCLALRDDPPGMGALLGRYESVLVESTDGCCWVATSYPSPKMLEDRIRNRMPGEKVNMMIADRNQIASVRQGFHHGRLLEQKKETSRAEGEVLIVRREEGYDRDLEERDVEATLRHLFARALLIGVSDIHFEEREVRVRKDGQLILMMSCELEKQRSMVSVIKGLAGMDQANFYNRQDGAFSLAMEKEWMNVRASAIPVKNHSRTQVTQKLVLRLLPKRDGPHETLEQLGYTANQAATLRRALSRPQGLMLITGPTGSGKTTTIYSLLSEIVKEGRNIMTLEDPIEYEIEGVNQTQLDPLRGLTLNEFRKGYVRQDPDVLFLGEIRDLDTAGFAVEASLTGHLVISTLHTESAVGAVHRLISLGVNTEILSQSLLLLQAQRLVRKLCNLCKRPIPENHELYRKWANVFDRTGLERPDSLYQAKGCPRCQDSGYAGRGLLVETVKVTHGMAQAIAVARLEDLFALRKIAVEQGATTLYQDSLRLLAMGILSLEDADLYGNPWEDYVETEDKEL